MTLGKKGGGGQMPPVPPPGYAPEVLLISPRNDHVINPGPLGGQHLILYTVYLDHGGRREELQLLSWIGGETCFLSC